MNDFDGLFTSECGFKPQDKSAPMAPPSKGSSNNSTSPLNYDFGLRSARSSTSDSLFGSSAPGKNHDFGSFNDLLTGTGSDTRRPDSPFNLNSVYGGPSIDFLSRSTNSPSPVYDDDIFYGMPMLKSTSKVNFDDVFASTTLESGAGGDSGSFDDLLGGFGKESKSSDKKRWREE